MVGSSVVYSNEEVLHIDWQRWRQAGAIMRYIMTTQGTYLAVFRSVKQLNIQHSWLTFYYFSAKNSRIFSLHALGTNISSNLNNAHLQQLVFIKEYYGL